MLRAFVRRALAGLAVIVGVVTLMFFLIRMAPGDPALLLVGPTATQEQLAAQRKALGLDRPLPEQYAAWLGRFVRGDWGSSIATGRPVRGMISAAWPATVSLVGLSLVLSYVIGIVVGAIQATRRGRLDTTLSVVTVTLFALPGYWLGLDAGHGLHLLGAGITMPLARPGSMPTSSPDGTDSRIGCGIWRFPSRL